MPSAAKADGAGQVDGMSAAKIAYRSTSATPKVVFTGGGLSITASCDSGTHDLTLTATTTKSASSIFSALTDTDNDSTVITNDIESQGYGPLTPYSLLSGATIGQEDPALVTFVYAAPDGVTVTGTLGVDAYDLNNNCSVAGTVVFG